jgi:hypothetical protein
MKKQVEDWVLLADNDLYAAEIIINRPAAKTLYTAGMLYAMRP